MLLLCVNGETTTTELQISITLTIDIAFHGTLRIILVRTRLCCWESFEYVSDKHAFDLAASRNGELRTDTCQLGSIQHGTCSHQIFEFDFLDADVENR